MIELLSIDRIIIFALIFIRISSIIVAAPFLGSPAVPPRVKLALGFLLTIVFIPLAGEHKELALWGFMDITFAIAREIFLGISIGFVATLIFAGINLAGQLMGFQMGFAIVNVMDPLNQTQVSVISQFIGFLSIILFITVNGHYWFIEAIAESFSFVKPGGAEIGSLLVMDIMRAGADMFMIALKLGAPLFAIMIAIYVGLGIINRTVPQMNVFIVGFPLTIGVGLIGIGLTLPLFYQVLRGLFEKVGWSISSVLKVI